MNSTYDTNVLMDDGTVIYTTVTSSGDAVEHFLEEISGGEGEPLIVGLDTEWRVTFDDGERAYRMAVLQLCVGTRCLVFQIVHVAAEVLARPELAWAGLKALAREVMGVHVDKPKHVTMSRWSRRPLSPEQVRYTAVDAFVSYEVGRLLLTSQRALELEAAAAAAGTVSPFLSFELP